MRSLLHLVVAILMFLPLANPVKAGASLSPPEREFVQWIQSDAANARWFAWRVWLETPGAREYWEWLHRTRVPPILKRIRGCESGNGPHHPGNYHITNSHGASSSSGAYQFVTGTWLAWRGSSSAPRAYLATPAEQDRAAIRLYNAQGTAPWRASASCWS